MVKKSCPVFIVYSRCNNGQAFPDAHYKRQLILYSQTVDIQYGLPCVVPEIVDGRDGKEEHDEHPAVVDDHMLCTFLKMIISGGGGARGGVI